MKVGYLHLTQPSPLPTSGVTRYSQTLATAARQRSDVAVLEATLSTGDSPQQFVSTVQTLTPADVIHVQHSPFVWHPQLISWLRSHPVPIVITLHDLHPHLYPTGSWGAVMWQASQQQRSLAKGKSLALRSTWRQTQQYWRDRTLLQSLSQVADRLLTCHDVEQQRVQQLTQQTPVTVIPHFVEPKAELPTPAIAKAKLGLPPAPMLTLQGYIYRTKGHELAVNALAHLPDEIQLVFAGGAVPGNEAFVNQLQALAQRLGVHHRLRMTGYLSNDDLDQYLAATDLAICPFASLSASGSLSTWIASGRPILAADQPQIHEYNRRVPNAVQTFQPYTPLALAQAAQSCLTAEDEPLGRNHARQQLRDALSLDAVIEQHYQCYRHVLHPPQP